jgi:hypothetical protein
MSVVSRLLMAGLACASLSVQALPAAARAQAAADDPSRNTGGRFMHAGKCTITFGFGGGCDKDEPLAKVAKAAKAEGEAKEAQRAGVTKTANESTKSQFFHASECVVSLGFVGPCDKNAPVAQASATRPAGAAPAAAPAAPPAPDNSTRSRFFHAGKCTITFGFGGGCDK